MAHNNTSGASAGSTPLTRGKLVPDIATENVTGLIPAHAGKTKSPMPPSRTTEAHPRSRGENALTMSVSGSLTGSSPLTRGKRVGIDGDRAVLRLIPAHAGKTTLSRLSP